MLLTFPENKSEFLNDLEIHGGVTTVDALVDQIKEWATEYEQGNPVISDVEFDEAVELLRVNDPDNPILKQAGWGYKPASNHLQEVKHVGYVGSLSKIKHADLADYKRDDDFILMPKFDGGSAKAYYKDGRLLHVVSRGNGTVGLDITQNVIAGGSVPQTISDKSIEWVRGEVTMTWKDFEPLGGSHPRNKAVGISQSKSATPEELNALTFIAYDSNLPFDWGNELNRLMSVGFEVTRWSLMNLKGFKELIELPKLIEEAANGYPIDGLVLRYGDDDAIAFKFHDVKVQTTVKDIEWKLSRTGRMVPIAKLEPTLLEGAVIQSATMNNWTYLQEVGAGPGATVELTRANLIIPNIKTAINRVEPIRPTHCPMCKTELEVIGADLRCTNEGCGSRDNASVWRVFDLCEVDGIGHSHIKTLLDAEEIEDIGDLKVSLESLEDYHFDELYGPATATKMKKVIEKINALRQNGTVWDLLYISNIWKIGERSMKALAENISAQDFIDGILADQIPLSWAKYCSTGPGFESLCKTQGRIQTVLMYFFEDTLKSMPKKEKKEITMRYCITGTLSKKRSEIEEEFEALGYESVGANKADILIDSGERESSKQKTAKKRGIPIMTEAEFRAKYVEDKDADF